MENTATDPAQFARSYFQAYHQAMNRLDMAELTAITERLWDAYRTDRQIFLLGNGGSAATASHIATDLSKGALGHRGDADARPIRVLSLTDNVSVISAWANDVDYESIFVGQLRAFLRERDTVIGISASGNSPNVLRAIRYAREVGATTIGLTGFGGGILAPLCDLSIVVESNHYGIVEDIHIQIGHIVAYFFRDRIAADLAVSGNSSSSESGR